MRGEYYLTVGELRKKLEGVEDETPVFLHRVEDVYFEKHGWEPNIVLRETEDEAIQGEWLSAWNAHIRSEGVFITPHY